MCVAILFAAFDGIKVCVTVPAQLTRVDGLPLPVEELINQVTQSRANTLGKSRRIKLAQYSLFEVKTPQNRT